MLQFIQDIHHQLLKTLTGGINNNSTLSIVNSTFYDNSADAGGGIYSYNGFITILNSTIDGNSANYYGGGIVSSNKLWNVILANTIIANNGWEDCNGYINDGGHNLDSDGSCSFDLAKGSLPNTDPRLGLLRDNGGPTWTQALLPDSPAIDAGDNAQCSSVDQRGFYRPIDGDGDGAPVCDMGSFEYGSIGPRGIYFLPPYPHAGGVPGVTITYHIALDNLTDLTDTYRLELGSHNWETAIFTDSLGPLPPAGSQAFTLTVTFPPEAAWYQADRVAITATSETSPTVYTTTVWVTTQAQPPFSLYLPILLKQQQVSNPVISTHRQQSLPSLTLTPFP